MSDEWLSDADLDAMFNEEAFDPVMDSTEIVRSAAEAELPPVSLYPLTMASGMNGANGDGVVGFMSRKVAGLPVWGWGLVVGAMGGAGYLYWRSTKQAPVKVNETATGDEASPSVEANGETWAPSRSKVAEHLRRYFTRKGQTQHVVVWHDADDAQKKGGLKFVSPLINVEVKGAKGKSAAVTVDAALTRFARKEGLNPVQHEDGSIGFYPHSSKRGQEWERYVDALRDDGQMV